MPKLFFDALSVPRATSPAPRRRTVAAITGDPQLSIQIRPAPGPTVHFPGQTRLGAVLLQGCTSRARRPDAQEPASLHRHEPHRSELRATDPGGEFHRIMDDTVFHISYIPLLQCNGLWIKIGNDSALNPGTPITDDGPAYLRREIALRGAEAL